MCVTGVAMMVVRIDVCDRCDHVVISVDVCDRCDHVVISVDV